MLSAIPHAPDDHLEFRKCTNMCKKAHTNLLAEIDQWIASKMKRTQHAIYHDDIQRCESARHFVSTKEHRDFVIIIIDINHSILL